MPAVDMKTVVSGWKVDVGLSVVIVNPLTEGMGRRAGQLSPTAGWLVITQLV